MSLLSITNKSHIVPCLVSIEVLLDVRFVLKAPKEKKLSSSQTSFIAKASRKIFSNVYKKFLDPKHGNILANPQVSNITTIY